jgi:hypothetical protein
MTNDERRFERLLELARRGRPVETPEPRFGFATRVAARWASSSPANDALFVWERLTRWGLAGALAVCLTVLAFSRDTLRAGSTSASALETLAGLEMDDESF